MTFCKLLFSKTEYFSADAQTIITKFVCAFFGAFMENKEDYKRRIKRHAPPSPVLKDCFFAFLFGGFICLIGQCIFYLYSYFGIEERDAYTLVTVTLILAAALLTGLGVFDNIARVAGAGTLLPVTGFANAVVSPAIDTKSEGLVVGVGGKIFTIAGPVILFGILSGAVYGVIYFVYTLFTG